MSVYVDDMRAPFGRMVMCHMFADSRDELLAMALRIDVPFKWLQNAGERHEHFDLSLSKRALAVKAGAIAITQRKLALLIRERVLAESAHKPGRE